MFLRRTAACAAVLSAVLGSFASCASETGVTAGGGGASPPDGGAPAEAGVEAAPPDVPAAEGDPCRGQPLPEDRHFVPAGLCARVVSPIIGGLRQIEFAPNGDLFGQSNSGVVWLLRDEDGDGVFSDTEVHEWASTGGNGNNAHVDAAGGYVYAGSADGVKRFAYDPSATKGGPAEDVVVGQPGGGHGKHTVHVYDGSLYVHSGSGGNATHSGGTGQSDYDTVRSLVMRFDLSKLAPGEPFGWADGEPFTLGLRNANGFDRNDLTGKIYAVVNGLDAQAYEGIDVHDDNPGEQVVELAQGKTYGYPFCFTAQRIVDGAGVVPPGTQLVNASYEGNPHDDAWCAANSTPPATFVQAHTAPLAISFFDTQPTGALPERWRGGAFIALHGSWNRPNPSGYRVVWQPFLPDGSSPMPTSTPEATTFPYEVVFGGGAVASGPVDGPWQWRTDTDGESPRPAGVAIGPIDGALYVASDASGYVYRIGVKP